MARSIVVTTTMMTKSAKEMIEEVYGSSKNFVTPHIISTVKMGKRGAIELSTGDCMGTKMFGVTVVRGGEKRKDLSDSFDNEEDANNYIKKLRNEFRGR